MVQLKGKNRKRGAFKAEARPENLLSSMQPSPLSVKKRRKESSDAEDEEEFLTPELSSRIMKQAEEQQRELGDDDDSSDGDDSVDEEWLKLAKEASDEMGIKDDSEHLTSTATSSPDEVEPVNADDDRAFSSIFTGEVNLTEMVMSKIRDAESGKSRERPVLSQLNQKIVDVYRKVGLLLSRYKSGKLPKAFKIIPTLANWEDILFLTEPEKWTPNAVYQATRIFASNFNNTKARRFYQLILLNRVRDDIMENKKLNPHLYLALKKAVYKPAAFFKGIILPICQSGDSTLREATILGSVLVKTSIPVLHSAAALLKIAEMEYSGSNSLFIKHLLDKKYALPYRVVDALVFHFLRFRQQEESCMPVIWHQALLVFVQRYKEDITVEQKEMILQLLKAQTHPEITPEVRRELLESNCRGDEVTFSEHLQSGSLMQV